MQHQNSYDPEANVPKLGTRWIWEANSASAWQAIEVIEVIWNGEEWWIRTRSGARAHLNDVGRFWEAVSPETGRLAPSMYEKREVAQGVESRWGQMIPVTGWD